jgi:hypothetical protein
VVKIWSIVQQHKRFFKDENGWKDQINIDLELTPLYENDKIYLQEWPEMEDGKACRVNMITLRNEVLLCV